MAKKIFTNQIDEKSLVLLSLYFFQPILIFWGLTKSPINYEFIASPFVYLVIVLFVLFILLLVNKLIFKDIETQIKDMKIQAENYPFFMEMLLFQIADDVIFDDIKQSMTISLKEIKI